MDSPVIPNPEADNNARSFYFKIENEMPFPSTVKSKSTLIKYTKLPDYDFGMKVGQPFKPRLRRIVEIDHPQLQTSRSLKLGTVSASRMNTTTKRKMVSIAENDDLTPSVGRVTQSSNRSSRTVLKDNKNAAQRNSLRVTSSVKGRLAHTTNRSTGTHINDDKNSVQRNTKPEKCFRASKLNVKPRNVSNKKEYGAPKTILHNKQTIASNHVNDNIRNRSTKDKEQPRLIKSTSNPSKVNISKHLVPPSESEILITTMKNELVKNSNTTPSKRLHERHQYKPKSPQRKTIVEILNEVPLRNPISVMHVPIEDYYGTLECENKSLQVSNISIPVQQSVDCGTDMDEKLHPKDANMGVTRRGAGWAVPTPEVPGAHPRILGFCISRASGHSEKIDLVTPMDANVGTSPLPTMVNEETETSNNTLTADRTLDLFDKLDIPDVTLIKDKSSLAKEEIVRLCSRSMPNLKASPFKISAEKESYDNPVASGKSKTYIIGRATLTYTTKQKINIHVVGSSDDSQSNKSPSPLAYPLNVVSLLKNNLNHSDVPDSSEGEHLANKNDKLSSCHNNDDELQALACPYVFNNNKLVKPSDLISTIRVNNGLLHNDYVSEQFQRELHFIDSFFESLQYLESCSLSEKCLSDVSSDNWVSKTRFDIKKTDYNSFLSKLENGAGALANVDDIETMASKSLCLLNLLIRNEQRRAKNLLFVLKMREDALKDFTKSQIIWLENKKKQDNTDVSTLKKKQRGALLKLQHECGEMQRMRKALLALSERRKAALMNTRNSIELKLKNNVDVEQILLGKKKLKRNTTADRNVAPLKCFDLSSSGCEDTSPTKPKEIPAASHAVPPSNSCAEKCDQTNDSECEPPVSIDHARDTAAEHFVAVDGGYLNILFQNLSLPQIFSSGKQYEVNEEALRKIVESSNKSHLKDHCESDVVENFMDKIRNRDSDRSSSASTAHSLVDEFDQYYMGLSDRSKSPADSPDTEYYSNTSIPQTQVFELSESCIQVMDNKLEQSEKCGSVGTIDTDMMDPMISSDTLTCVQSCVYEVSSQVLESQSLKDIDVPMSSNQTGPLPVPPGAPSPEPVPTDSSSDVSTISPGSSSIGEGHSLDSLVTVSSLGHNEAEELRRQQLAIEREIKALEQQQNQLLVVREIPDKPPPPYTPPNNPLAKVPRMFVLTEEIEEKIQKHVTHGDQLEYDPNDPFGVFISDICEESLARQRMELSDKPWDACNLLPHKQVLSPRKRGRKTISEINQVLSGIPPAAVSGVGARRSDHIDDILFAEWRRCEPEWTTLHADEAAIKAQVFESLFQKVLSETIDQYKQTVLGLIAPQEPTEKTTRKISRHPKLAQS